MLTLSFKYLRNIVFILYFDGAFPLSTLVQLWLFLWFDADKLTYYLLDFDSALSLFVASLLTLYIFLTLLFMWSPSH